MALTLTPRFGLPQWGLGSDPPARTTFDAAFLAIEQSGALDDGASYSAVPTTGLVAGRYARVTTSDGSYTLYRRSTGAWEYVGGPVAPVRQRVVALTGQASTDYAFTIEPTIGVPSWYTTYGGDTVTAGTMRTSGVLAAVPYGDTLTLTTTGRAYVKTQAAGELGLVIRAHASTAGNLLTVREQGGSDIVTIDSLGRVQSRVASAFGGASIPSTAVAAIAPTSSTTDGVTTGLLLYGQPSAPAKALLSAYAASGDTAQIAQWLPNGMSLGKLPWGSAGNSDGSLTLAADVIYLRAIGANLPGSSQYSGWLSMRRALATAQSDPAQDIGVLALGLGGASLSLPTYLDQEHNGNTTNLTLNRFNDFTAGRFLELLQVTRVDALTVTSNTVADWSADGRLRSGMTWKGASTVRDARLAIKHVSSKTWAVPGNGPTAGQQVPSNSTYTYTFPVMTSRSFGGCDLDIKTMTELMVGHDSTGAVDAQVYWVECYIAINGGSFNSVLRQENVQTASPGSAREAGDLMNSRYRVSALPNGATFQIQLHFGVGTPTSPIYLRKFDLEVEECSFEVYVAS